MAYKINIKEIQKYYNITEYGEVYSKIKNRWLKPQVNSVGYVMYFLSYPVKRWYTAHSLVAGKFIGERPMGYDINHLDGEKGNNHYNNLEYITHSENIKKGYRIGFRQSYWKGKTKLSPQLITRVKMSNAKKRPVKYGSVTYDSIGGCAQSLGTYREAIYRGLKKGSFRGVNISLL